MVYVPTFTIKSAIHVGKYTIHDGMGKDPAGMSFLNQSYDPKNPILYPKETWILWGMVVYQRFFVKPPKIQVK